MHPVFSFVPPKNSNKHKKNPNLGTPYYIMVILEEYFILEYDFHILE